MNIAELRSTLHEYADELQDIGLHRATDLDGRFQAWKAAGLPVDAAT